ncbi:uncharacterized protein LOC134648730 [Cydia amplana]|uniref:uncharacterized protein LOC134648730 n=1 Tax=Cydia amplana TaxID=1869771 RepID=UPI002FE5B316
MQVVIACVLSLAVSGLAKPFYGEYLRVPRSHLGGYGGYISPCAAVGGYHHAIPAYHAQQSYGPVGYGHAHIGGYGGGYGGPHYRADEMEENANEEPETMSFSEMEPSENAPEARYVPLGGSYAAPHASSYGAIGAASPGAVGVFPGAHVSGCNVPLLLSCSPSIVPGRIVSHGSSYGSHAAYGSSAIVGAGAGAGAYRSDSEATHDLTPSEQPAAEPHTTTVHEAANITPAKTQ